MIESRDLSILPLSKKRISLSFSLIFHFLHCFLLLILTIFNKQLQLKAYETGYPDDFVTEILNVTINRNPNNPTWTTANYDVNVNEEEPFGYSVLTLSASDADGVCIL